MLAADVAQTADRLVQMQRVLGVPRNYVGFPNDWDPFQPLLMLEGVSLPTPVGGEHGIG